MLAKKWQLAAPNSLLDNLYGPTETTLAVMGYRWNKFKSIKECHNGVVPIGKIFSGHKILKSNKNIFDLNIAGKQVFDGYIKNKFLNKEKFILQNKKKFFKTGDLISINKFKNYNYLGRVDRQIKVKGLKGNNKLAKSKLKWSPKLNIFKAANEIYKFYKKTKI